MKTRLAFAKAAMAAALAAAMAFAANPPASAAGFDGARALRDIETQVAFGPRVPGKPGHKAAREWIVAQIRELGFVAVEDPFEAKLALIAATGPAVNIWALPKPEAEMTADARKLILISAHWDSRPLADRDANAPREAMPAANDGASGVAVALEFARGLKRAGLADRVALAFWDAEDSGVESDNKSYCVGSQRAAANPPAWFGRVAVGINLDMVGAKGARFGMEPNSVQKAPSVFIRLWNIGMDLAPGLFADKQISPMYDDHIPFLDKGLPYVDIIGFPYPHWHTTQDTPDKCDPQVMRQLGDVLREFARREINLFDEPK